MDAHFPYKMPVFEMNAASNQSIADLAQRLTQVTMLVNAEIYYEICNDGGSFVKRLFSIWIPLASIILTIVFPFYFEHRAFKSSSLEIREISPITFSLASSKGQNKDADNGPSLAHMSVPTELGITINGKPYDSVRVSYWQIQNNGKNPMQIKDYTIPITLSVKEGAKLILVKTEGTSDKGIIGRWTISKDSKSATLDPVLLNPSDWLIVCYAMQFDPNNTESQNVSWYARIAGITKLNVIDIYSHTPDIRNIAILFSGYEIAVLVAAIILVFMSMFILSINIGIMSYDLPYVYLIMAFNVVFSLTTGETAAWVILKKGSLPPEVVWPLWVLHLVFVSILLKPVLLRSRAKGDQNRT